MIGALFKAFTMAGSEWVMWLLMFLSVVSMAIIFDRLRNLRSQERLGASLWKEQVDPWIANTESGSLMTKAKEISSTYPCLEGDLIELISTQGKNITKSDLELLITGYLGKKKLELEKNLAFLGTVGSNAPFIGLFGTVLGIIKAFHDLGGKVESAGAQTVSVGLSEALVATAIGLVVAIPAVAFFNYFQRKIKMIIGRAESLSNYLMSQRSN